MTKLQQKKKKARERRVEEKMYRRRTATAKVKKFKSVDDQYVKELEKKAEDQFKLDPVAKTREEILAKLERNFEILKALEEEHEKETGKRGNVTEEASEALKRIESQMLESKDI